MSLSGPADILETDVVVVGAGNAGLCAALAALESGAEVIVLEKAPKLLRGGNTAWTVRPRFSFAGLDDLRLLADIDEELGDRMEVTGYSTETFAADLMRASQGLADPTLSRIIAEESLSAMTWLAENGMRFAPMLEASREVDGRLIFGDPSRIVAPAGGGAEILRALNSAVQKRGGMVLYECAVVDIIGSDGAGSPVTGVLVDTPEGVQPLRAKAVVLAAGGFEANPEMRARYLGPGWDTMKIRGSRFNTGEVLDGALRYGARPYGHYSGAHATMVHGSAPRMEMGEEVAYPHGFPFSIMVNRDGRRFVDEGADFFTKTYAAYGKNVLSQPGGMAYQIFDAHSAQWRSAFGEQWYGVEHFSAGSIDELAQMTGISRDGLVATVREFNAAVQPGEFSIGRLDGKRTRGLEIDKSNWALEVATPPFEAFPVECGMTFTYGGLATTEHGEVIGNSGHVISGLYAVGEIQGTFFHSYPGGAGLTKGSVFGRRAGVHAAGLRGGETRT